MTGTSPSRSTRKLWNKERRDRYNYSCGFFVPTRSSLLWVTPEKVKSQCPWTELTCHNVWPSRWTGINISRFRIHIPVNHNSDWAAFPPRSMPFTTYTLKWTTYSSSVRKLNTLINRYVLDISQRKRGRLKHEQVLGDDKIWIVRLMEFNQGWSCIFKFSHRMSLGYLPDRKIVCDSSTSYPVYWNL